MTIATKGIETTNVDIDEARAIYSKLMNKLKRAGSIIFMCVSAILAKALMPIGIARLPWAPWNCAYC